MSTTSEEPMWRLESRSSAVFSAVPGRATFPEVCDTRTR
jgi:hypothetical protein